MSKVLDQLDERWVRAASKELCENLSALFEQKCSGQVEKILAWTSFFHGEVDLTEFISAQVEKSEVYLPRSLPDFSMTFISIGSNWKTEVDPGAYGIPEPSGDAGTIFSPLESSEDTVVLVPGLAFDRKGNRIGRGKGYYDRFLSREDLRDAVRIGVLWELQLVESLSARAHDIPVHYIVHEGGWLLTQAGEERMNTTTTTTTTTSTE